MCPGASGCRGQEGGSVAYVFLHLFPELGEGQKHMEEVHSLTGLLQNHVYLMALVGLAVFYGLERVAVISRQEMLLFSVAMALHFVINDFGLQELHRSTYGQLGRWILVAALLLGLRARGRGLRCAAAGALGSAG